MSAGIRPVLSLLRAAILPPLLRLQSRCLCPLAPADMHMRIAIRLANLERPQ